MSAPDRDPFALGDTDPLIALGAEWDELLARADLAVDHGPPGEADRISLLAVHCEDRIAEVVPTSAAGAVVQLKLFRQLASEFEWDDLQEKIAANLIAGLERLGEDGAS
jgi:hypothetical protein